jgi:ADP-ribosyl-[dinitrogen reductase] hydrolase
MVSALDPQKRSRILGSYYGALSGDALGAPYEFKTRDSYEISPDYVPCTTFHVELPLGGWTDDSSMLLCLLESLLENKGEWNAGDCLNRWIRWMSEGYMSVVDECFDIGMLRINITYGVRSLTCSCLGMATSTALIAHQSYFKRRGTFADEDELVYNALENMSGNGSLMRLCPAPLLYINSQPWEVADIAQRTSLPTHGSYLCTGSCALFALYIYHFVHSTLPTPAERKQSILSPDFDLLKGTDKPTYLRNPRIEAIRIGEGWRGLPRNKIRTSGFVIHTIQAALWALSTFDTFEQGMLALMEMGEDVDTVSFVTSLHELHLSDVRGVGMLCLWADCWSMLRHGGHSSTVDRWTGQEGDARWICGSND